MQNIFQHILSFHLSYRDIITCTRVCHTWYRAFNPCLKILHEWYAEKTPQRFLSDALEVDDIRLVDFARNVLKASRFRGICIKSQKMYNHMRNYVQNNDIRIKWGDVALRLNEVVTIDIKIKYGHIKRTNANYSISSAIYADNVELLQKIEITRFSTEMAALHGSFKCLDYCLSKITVDILYSYPSPSQDCVQSNFESILNTLINDPKYNKRIQIDWNTVFKMSVLNSSERWFNVSLEHVEKPLSISMLALNMCKSRKILMALVDMFRDSKEILDELIENGDKRVIEKINALIY